MSKRYRAVIEFVPQPDNDESPFDMAEHIPGHVAEDGCLAIEDLTVISVEEVPE